MYNILEDTDTRYRDNPRSPTYNPRNKKCIIQCDICGEDVDIDDCRLDGYKLICPDCAEILDRPEEEDNNGIDANGNSVADIYGDDSIYADLDVA